MIEKLMSGTSQDNLWRAQTRAVLDGAVDAILTIDARGIIQLVNPATERLFGYEAAELIGQNVAVLMTRGDGDHHDGHLTRYQRTGVAHIIGIGRQVTARRRDGTTFQADLSVGEAVVDGQIYYTGILRDLTRRIADQTRLKLQSRVIDSVSEGICVSDPTLPDNPIVMVNPAFERLTGYTADEVIGTNCRFLQGSHQDQASLRTLRESILTGQPCRVLLRNVRKDGTEFWNDLQIDPVHDETGRLTHFVGIQSDATERVEAEARMERLVEERTAELKQAQEQLLRQSRLAMLGQLGGSIAHEIRNPLGAIKTSAYYLLHAPEPPAAKVTEHLERIDRKVTTINQVVTALTDAARMPTPAAVSTDLGQLIRAVAAELDLPGEIELVDEIHLGVMVMVDEAQIAIVVKNLVRNARDAMAGGGRLTLRVAARGGEGELIVRDTGPGIDAAVLGRLTEPLVSTKPTGMGLGLSICQSIVDNHRGRLSIVSSPGRGTTVTVRLPSAQRNAERKLADDTDDPGR